MDRYEWHAPGGRTVSYVDIRGPENTYYVDSTLPALEAACCELLYRAQQAQGLRETVAEANRRIKELEEEKIKLLAQLMSDADVDPKVLYAARNYLADEANRHSGPALLVRDLYDIVMAQDRTIQNLMRGAG